MNQKEWKYLRDNQRSTLDFTYYNRVRKIQKSLQYNPDKDAKTIHHLRDTEEQRKYNDEHYELWGFEIDENDNEHFTYGKYVIFLTKEEHDTHHKFSSETRKKISDGVNKALDTGLRERRIGLFAGERNPMYSKRGPQSTCFGRCGELHPMYGKKGYWAGKHLSEESRHKISLARIATVQRHKELYNKYTEFGGTLSKRDFIHILGIYNKSHYWLDFSFSDFIENCKESLGL